jgi:septal ring factor EnvC (AmiA/AmiB activator)
MLGKSQLDTIMAEKNSAFKVLIATKNKLVASCQKAKKFTDKNLNQINKKEQEIKDKHDMNAALDSQVKHMEASIAETDRIVNPVIVEEISDDKPEVKKEEGSKANA